MMLMSIGDNLKYEPGYYEITVKYSIDNFTTLKAPAEVLIKNQRYKKKS